jgi:C4-dicarboxylate-binding protein DctP
MKRSAIGFVVIALAIAQQSVVLASEPVVIKFSHVTAKNTPKGEAAEYFKKLAEERTGGRVRVEVYPNSVLYKDGEEMEMLQIGAVQMLAPSLAKFGPLGVREFEVFDLPFLFDGYDDLHKVTQGPVGRALLKKLEAKGITGLAFWDNGFKVMSANRPLRTPADFKGLKMRIQSSKVLDQEMRDLGALPQVTALSEAYQALQTGVVDGTENPPSNLYTQRMHEVQKFVAVSNHGYLGYAVIVNRTFWSGLPPTIRRTLEGAMRDATVYVNQLAKQENDDALEAVRKAGRAQVYALTAEERLSWKKALLPVHREQAARIGMDTLSAIYEATRFDPGKL